MRAIHPCRVCGSLSPRPLCSLQCVMVRSEQNKERLAESVATRVEKQEVERSRKHAPATSRLVSHA